MVYVCLIYSSSYKKNGVIRYECTRLDVQLINLISYKLEKSVPLTNDN